LGPALAPYQRQWLRADVLAGLATGAVVIPQAMAYAIVAKMPVEIGLYTCMVPLVVYVFIGGSRTASVTTTSTIATLTASTMIGAGLRRAARDGCGIDSRSATRCSVAGSASAGPHRLSGALAIALMAFLETAAVARSVRRAEEPQINADRELTRIC
jgi:MFS superfamily sulfate permease-like transporter